MKRVFLICLFFVVAGAMTANAAVISGIVSDSADAPLKGIYVALRTTDGAGTTLAAKDTTDSTGAYSVTWDSTSGTYTLRTTDLANPTVYITQYDTVTLDGTDKTVNIKMAAIKWSSISGMVSDSVSGTPIAGATVRTGMRTATTDSTGHYAFDSVMTGTTTINASAAGYVAKTVSVTIGDSALTADIPLALIKYSSVSGTVSDSASGTPIAGAIVRLGTIRFDTTDTNGTYSFDSVATGKVAIRVTAQGYTEKTDSVVVGDAALTADIKLVTIKYSSISGTVSDSATESAISGAIVRCGTRRDTTAEDGKYELDSVATGPATINVSAQGYAAQSISVTVGDSGVTADVKLVAIPLGSIAGTVADSVTGSAIAGAIVRLSRGFSTVGIDTSASDGTFLFDYIEFGTYTITTSASKYNMHTDSVVVSDTARTTININLAGIVYFAVSGKITDSITGEAIVGGFVALRSGTGITYDSVFTDSSGQYTFDSAFSGNRVKVMVPGYDTARVILTATTSEAQTVDVKIVKVKSAIRTVKGISKNQKISITTGRLIINNMSSAGTVRLWNMKGELVCLKSFPACAMLSMNLGNRLPAGSYILKVSQTNYVLLRKVILR